VELEGNRLMVTISFSLSLSKRMFKLFLRENV